MPNEANCPQCGAVLPPRGQCVNCLLSLGFESLGEEALRAPEKVGKPDDDRPVSCQGGPEQPGDRLGPYKLLQKLGEGGMGTVWMAEQTEPIRRKVALKIVKPGMDSAKVLARFEAERQALALMDHPNIAKVLDAGATETGRPYFVMELVKGVRLTEFCDERHLSIRERLELFIPVCNAIQHAHQKGIIHRDIKPSNVLVALYDSKPVPKVIDFGIAKATGQQLTERTLFTQFGALVGTPEYMSPEQAELNQLDIDTRSDVYSLGVLLYELLTGSTPLTREELARLAFDQVLRCIREQEPPKPSTRLSQSSERLPAISTQRKVEPGQLMRVMRGDLDWIVMKALEKERNRRYETANSLAADIERHLSNEPVVARPPSNLYRLQKALRRNKLAFAAGAVLLCALGIGLGGMTWALSKERALRAAAMEAKRSMDEVIRRVVFNGMGSGPVSEATIRLHGLSFELTRNKRIEEIVESELSNVCKDVGSKSALGIVVEPTSGDIVAMASFPHQNMEETNPCVSLSVQPYGLISFVLAAAAINEGLVTLDTLVDCECGRTAYGGVPVRDQESYAILTVEEIVMKSSRIGAMKLAVLLGNKRLHRYLRGFGFGEKRGIHLVGESSGMVPALTNWSEETTALTSTGQGLAVTPLQLAMAMAAIANGGELMTPRIIRSIRDEGGNEVASFRPELARQVISEQTANKLKSALVSVVSKNGTGVKARVEGFTVAGATGSSLGVLNATHTNEHCCFVGFLPVEKPAFVCLIYVNEPGLHGWAGKVAAPVFARVARQIAGHLNLKPSDTAELEPQPVRSSDWPEDAVNLNNFAWLYATSTQDNVRAARLAIVLAEKAVTETGRKQPLALDTLAAACAAANRFPEAIRHQQAALRLLTNRVDMAPCLLRLQLYESGKDYYSTQPNELAPNPGKPEEMADFFHTRANWFARFALWAEAARDSTTAIESDPDACSAWFDLAPLLFQCGNLRLYQQHRRSMLARFKDTEDAELAGRTAKACLLGSISGDELVSANLLADTAISGTVAYDLFPSFQLGKGLAEYRQGHFLNAAEWAGKALRKSGGREHDAKAYATQAYVILAMARYCSRQVDQARDALLKADELARKSLPKLDGGDIGPAWQEVLFANILLREAQELDERMARLRDKTEDHARPN